MNYHIIIDVNNDFSINMNIVLYVNNNYSNTRLCMAIWFLKISEQYDGFQIISAYNFCGTLQDTTAI